MTAASPEDLPARLPVVPGETLPTPPTIPRILQRGVERWADQELLIHDRTHLTWAQVERRSAELAKGLLAIGVGKGCRVGLLMPNSADWVIAFLAATRIGALVSPISTFLQGPELDRALAHADIQVLLCVDEFLSHDYLSRLDGLPGMASQSSTEIYLCAHP